VIAIAKLPVLDRREYASRESRSISRAWFIGNFALGIASLQIWVVQSTVNVGKTELMQGKRTNIELKEERSPWQETLIANGEIMQASLRLHVKI